MVSSAPFHHSRRWARRACLGAGLGVALLAIGRPAGALTVGGQAYEDTATVAGTPLRLNGAGVASKFGFSFYTAALYLRTPSPEARTVLADTGPKRLRLRVNVAVAADEFGKALRNGVAKRATPAAQARLAPRIDRFHAQVKALGELKQGDAIDIDYLPGKGTLLSLNGQVRSEPIDGAELYAAILDMYVGDQPINAKLKAGLLGTPAQ